MLIIGLQGGAGILTWFAAASWLWASYLVLAATVAWWIAPRLGYCLWLTEGQLHWRWGVLHHEAMRCVAVRDIVRVEVVALPDFPFRHVRSLNGVEIHGGNFTPSLNRGVQLHLHDGRKLCFVVPEPNRLAAALLGTESLT